MRAFIGWRAAVRYRYVQDKSGIDLEDLIQAGYLGLVDAVDSFDRASGYSFLTTLNNCLKTAFNDACGTGWNRIAKDPIHSAISLDTPVNAEDPEGPTLEDMQPAADDVAEEVEQRVYNEELREAIERLLSRLTPEAADMIRRTYFHSEGAASLAARYGTTEKNLASRRNGYMIHLRSLARNTPEGRNLRRFLEDNTNYYYHVGPQSFNTTHTSAPEYLTMYRDRLERKMMYEGIPKEKGGVQ